MTMAPEFQLAYLCLLIPAILGWVYIGRAIFFFIAEGRRAAQIRDRTGEFVSFNHPLGTFKKYFPDDEWVADLPTELGTLPFFVTDRDGTPDPAFLSRLPDLISDLPSRDAAARSDGQKRFALPESAVLVGITQEADGIVTLDYANGADRASIGFKGNCVVDGFIGG